MSSEKQHQARSGHIVCGRFRHTPSRALAPGFSATSSTLSGVSAATEQEQTERRVIVVFQATRSGKAVPGAQMWWMWDSKFTQILQILLAATQPYTKRIWQGIVGKWSGWSYAARTTSHIAIGVVRRPPNKTSRFARVTPQALRFFISSTVFLLPLTTRCDGCG